MPGILYVILEELIFKIVRWKLRGFLSRNCISENSQTCEMSPEQVLEGLYQNKLRGSEQLQTAFAMYNHEMAWRRVIKH